MQEHVNIKGVQQLTGQIAALSYFINRLGERTLPFSQLLRKGGKFEWTEEARTAFADLKKTLSTPPILAVPKEREPPFLYIASRSSVVSTSLVVERLEEGKVQGIQRPIYYLTEVLKISTKVPTLPEARVRHCHVVEESIPLLRRAPDGFSALVGYPKWKVRCIVVANFPWQKCQG